MGLMSDAIESAGDLLRLHPDVVFRSVGDEGVVIDQRRPEVMVVNGLGLRVLELIREKGARSAVLARLEAEYGVAPKVLAADLDAYLTDLGTRGLIDTRPSG